MTRSIKYSILPVLIGFLMSCSSSLELVENVDLPKEKEADLVAALDSLSAISFDSFYSKVSTKYKDSAQNVSFKTSMRIVNDSAVNTTITYAGIPVMNALVTTDSIKISNKRDKCFVGENLQFFKQQFGIDFSYENIEELLIGKPVAYDSNKKYYQVNDLKTHTMCSHRKKDIKRNERKDEREIITYYNLTSDLKNLESMQIISPADSTMIQIEYNERELISGYMAPKLVDVTIYTPKQEIVVNFDYRKTRVNESTQIHFVIPESYEKCK